MTNREWLDNLSDYDLAHWLCDCFYDGELSIKCGYPIYAGVSTIKSAYNNSLLGLQKWLCGERRTEE